MGMVEQKRPWTDDELRRFDRVTLMLSSRDQLQRIQGRQDIKKLVEEFGKEKCDAMFAHLQERDKKKGRK